MARSQAVPGDVPPDVQAKVDMSARAVAGLEPGWQESLSFFGNDQYVEISAVTGSLDRLEVREGGSKPRWRERRVRNRMTPKMMAEASLLTSRVPRYGIDPPNGDPSADNQAQLGEKVLEYQHRNVRMVEATIDTLLYAMGTGAGFLWPWWDPTIGPVVGEKEGKVLCEGDINRSVLHQGEVLWEPGMSFHDSPWWCIRKAQPVSYVKMHATKNAENIVPDARQGNWEKPGVQKGQLVFVYNYIERPMAGKPGQWLTFASKHQIREKRPYPRESGKPCLHMLPWIPQPHRHRPLGAGEMLVECQRSYNRAVNQIISFKNHALMPQLLAPEGCIIGEVTDEPGVVIQYRPVSGLKPEWRPVQEIPQTLFQTLDQALADMDDILGSHDLPTGVETGTAIEKVNERDGSRRAVFIRTLAEWYSDIGQHMLELTQQHYTEKRLISVNGKFMPDRIPDFLGRDLGELGTVQVSPDDITPRTREVQEARIQYYADRQWIQPFEAMKALDAGTADVIIDEIELDENKQDREIRRMVTLEARIAGVTNDQDIQNIIDLENAGRLDMPSEEFPMPGPHDNHRVHMHRMEIWFKTRDFDKQPDMVKAWAMDHYEAHDLATQAEEIRQGQMQALKAQSLGQENAAVPPSVGVPSQPKEGANQPEAARA